MNNAGPIFDPTTHYQIKVQGQVDVEWLQSFDSSAEILVDETRQMEGITVLDVHTDQSGIVGLVRRLHGLGMTILQFQMITRNERGTDMDMRPLDATYAAELLQRQNLLQAESRQVLAELDLIPCLNRLGHAEHIGSSVSGLMVWRDLDVGARCPQPSVERVFDTLRPIMIHPGVHEVLYREETGPRSPSGQLQDQRYYFVIRYTTAASQRWKIDISVWLTDAPRNQLGHLDYLARHLTDETRLAILWIKDVWHRLPAYPDEVSGTDIYTAVLDHGVRTPAQFAAYLRDRDMATNG